MNYYNEIKEELINNEIYKKSKDYSKNKNDLMTYYNVGKLLIDAQGGEKRAKYGDGLIKEYSVRLSKEVGKGYSAMNLKNMRNYYLFQKGQTVSVQLTWSHYIELLRLKKRDEINYYINICEKQNLSVRELRSKIKNKEYERLDDKTKEKFKKKEPIELIETIKEPIIIKSNNEDEHVTEKALKRMILENLDDFLNELGSGYTYVGNEYKIKMGSSYNYIDLLLFNYIYNSFIVIELKVTELKKEHIGQILTYVKYIDRKVKSLNHNKTIGIILVRKNNKFIMEYVTDENIISKEYIIL